MEQVTEIPVSNINNNISTYTKSEDQFCELMTNISYGIKQINAGKWNRAEYYNYMADFFDYLRLPADAQEHRDLADQWLRTHSEI